MYFEKNGFEILFILYIHIYFCRMYGFTFILFFVSCFVASCLCAIINPVT